MSATRQPKIATSFSLITHLDPITSAPEDQVERRLSVRFVHLPAVGFGRMFPYV